MKIFTTPAEVGAIPHYHEFPNREEFFAAEKAFVQRVKNYAKAFGKGEFAGEEIRFSVADGYARYIVLTPTSLMYLPLGDAYQFQYANRLTAKDLKAEVTRQRAFEAIFAKSA